MGALAGRAGALPRKVILTYHALGPHAPAVSTEGFNVQLQWLRAHATVMPLQALLDTPAAGLQVALTFDDGYACLHDLAAPLLQAAGMEATVYLNTAHIGDTQRQPSNPTAGHYPAQEFLRWQDVRALVAAGWTIGSHGMEHLDLSWSCSAVARTELQGSRAAIEAQLGISCVHFAYTWGRYRRPLQQLVREAGYDSAVCTRHGPVLLTSDPYALPRLDVRADYQLQDFIDVVCGRWDWLRYKQWLTGMLA